MSQMTSVIATAKERPDASANVRPDTKSHRRAIPWFTVVAIAAIMAFADGFWMTTLRGAVGSILRTQSPFSSWMQESTLLLPVFFLAVLGAFVLARRWFGPELHKLRSISAAALIIVVAGTLVGIAALAASSAYDFHLQSTQMMSAVGAMASMMNDNGAALALQFRSVGIGSGLMLVTNLVAVGWVIALRGGRLDVSPVRQKGARAR